MCQEVNDKVITNISRMSRLCSMESQHLSYCAGGCLESEGEVPRSSKLYPMHTYYLLMCSIYEIS